MSEEEDDTGIISEGEGARESAGIIHYEGRLVLVSCECVCVCVLCVCVCVCVCVVCVCMCVCVCACMCVCCVCVRKRERERSRQRPSYLIKLHTAIDGILQLIHLWIHIRTCMHINDHTCNTIRYQT